MVDSTDNMNDYTYTRSTVLGYNVILTVSNPILPNVCS